MRTLERGDFGWDYLVTDEDGSSEHVQTDWDYPGLARSFGWDMRRVQLNGGRDVCGRFAPRCEHRSTDGTVPCRECGLTASHFIGAAQAWLDDNIGATVED